MRSISHFADGGFVEPTSDRWYEKVSPVTGMPIARVHEADRDMVDRAVGSARRALSGPWGMASVQERAAILRRIADRIAERGEEFVLAETADTGKPVHQVRELDVARAEANFRTFADIIAAEGQPSFLTELPGGRQALNYAVRKPLGVVAVIVPWNLPLLLLTWKAAAALACGNAIVVKPSEHTPSSAALLAQVVVEAGLPSGAYNVINGFGTASAGEFLVGHPGVDGVTFTGSSAIGSKVMAGSAPRVRPVSFELGGKNAAIVFADADLDRTLAGLERSIFSNTGQVCLCTERVYVQRAAFDDIADGLTQHAAALRLGKPTDPTTTTGPLISHAHREKVLGYYQLAQECGAKVLAGGGIPVLSGDLASGSWIEPTVWMGLSNADRPMREEIFGPVAGLIPFDTEDEAIALANDTDYGLAASVWTTNLSRAHHIAQQMRVGMSWVNAWFLRDLRSPFGGIGLSGIGREGGRHSIDFYSQLTNVCVQL